MDRRRAEVPEGGWFRVLTGTKGGKMRVLGRMGVLEVVRFRRAYARMIEAEIATEEEGDSAA